MDQLDDAIVNTAAFAVRQIWQPGMSLEIALARAVSDIRNKYVEAPPENSGFTGTVKARALLNYRFE